MQISLQTMQGLLNYTWSKTGPNLMKGKESLQQTQIFLSLYLFNLTVQTFDISNLDYFIKQNL